VVLKYRREISQRTVSGSVCLVDVVVAVHCVNSDGQGDKISISR
jgi:hypothetical protein